MLRTDGLQMIIVRTQIFTHHAKQPKKVRMMDEHGSVCAEQYILVDPTTRGKSLTCVRTPQNHTSWSYEQSASKLAERLHLPSKQPEHGQGRGR
jgi:hypothetical protein